MVQQISHASPRVLLADALVGTLACVVVRRVCDRTWASFAAGASGGLAGMSVVHLVVDGLNKRVVTENTKSFMVIKLQPLKAFAEESESELEPTDAVGRVWEGNSTADMGKLAMAYVEKTLERQERDLKAYERAKTERERGRGNDQNPALGGASEFVKGFTNLGVFQKFWNIKFEIEAEKIAQRYGIKSENVTGELENITVSTKQLLADLERIFKESDLLTVYKEYSERISKGSEDRDLQTLLERIDVQLAMGVKAKTAENIIEQVEETLEKFNNPGSGAKKGGGLTVSLTFGAAKLNLGIELAGSVMTNDDTSILLTQEAAMKAGLELGLADLVKGEVEGDIKAIAGLKFTGVKDFARYVAGSLPASLLVGGVAKVAKRGVARIKLGKFRKNGNAVIAENKALVEQLRRMLPTLFGTGDQLELANCEIGAPPVRVKAVEGGLCAGVAVDVGVAELGVNIKGRVGRKRVLRQCELVDFIKKNPNKLRRVPIPLPKSITEEATELRKYVQSILAEQVKRLQELKESGSESEEDRKNIEATGAQIEQIENLLGKSHPQDLEEGIKKDVALPIIEEQLACLWKAFQCYQAIVNAYDREGKKGQHRAALHQLKKSFEREYGVRGRVNTLRFMILSHYRLLQTYEDVASDDEYNALIESGKVGADEAFRSLELDLTDKQKSELSVVEFFDGASTSRAFAFELSAGLSLTVTATQQVVKRDPNVNNEGSYFNLAVEIGSGDDKVLTAVWEAIVARLDRAALSIEESLMKEPKHIPTWFNDRLSDTLKEAIEGALDCKGISADIELNKRSAKLEFHFVDTETDHQSYALQYCRLSTTRSTKLGIKGVPIAANVTVGGGVSSQQFKHICERIGSQTITYLATCFHGWMGDKNHNERWPAFIADHRTELIELFREIKKGKSAVRHEIERLSNNAGPLLALCDKTFKEEGADIDDGTYGKLCKQLRVLLSNTKVSKKGESGTMRGM